VLVPDVLNLREGVVVASNDVQANVNASASVGEVLNSFLLY
jgi:hypothetical protein